MQNFFLKKNLFAAFFLIGLLLFSALNILYGKEELAELGEDILEIRTIEDMESWIAEVESVVNENVLGRMPMIEIYGYVQKILGKQEFNNFSYIKTEDGNLFYGSVTPTKLEDYTEYGRRMKRLQEKAKKNRGGGRHIICPATF